MSLDEYTKELNYLIRVKQSKQHLIDYYKKHNRGAIKVLKSELARVEERIKNLQVDPHYEEVSVEKLSEMFK